MSARQPPARDGTAPSLLRRVFVRMSLTMAGAIALVVTVLYVELAGHMDTLRDRSLSGQAADIGRYLVTDGDGRARVDLPPGLAAAYGDPAQRRFAVLTPNGRLLAGSAGVDGALDPDGLPDAGSTRYFAALDPHTGNDLYGASVLLPTAAGVVTVQVAQSAGHGDVAMDTFLDELGDEVLWVVLVVFATILLVTWLTLRASLGTLTTVSRQAAAIGPESLDRRLSLEGVPSEVTPMVRAVNAALDRVEEAFRQQRRFTADAAHEMRTPIAVLRAHLDTLEDAHAGELAQDLQALDRVVAQLLKLAQADSLSLEPRGRADLHEVAVNVAALMGPAAIRAGRELAVTGDDACVVAGDGDALEVALRNLVENALNHAPTGSEVEIQVDAGARELRVLDRGPGVPEADREQVFRRFWRGGHRTGTGAGLGLSIVARIAMAHGATSRVEDRAGGGAAFVLSFPTPAES